VSMDKFLRLMVEKTASDLFITAGVPPSMKVHGKLVPLNKTVLGAEQAREIVFGLMNDRQQAEFEEKKFRDQCHRYWSFPCERILPAQRHRYGVASYRNAHPEC
jgi:Tfp pilus assembly ATPase PilU